MHTLGLLTLILGGPAVAAFIAARHARRFGYKQGRWDGLEEGYADAMRDGWRDTDGVYQQGYRDGACDLEDTKADVADLEQRFYALSTQRRAA